MTLDTLIVCRFIVEKLLVLGAVGPVTTQTVQGQVRISRIDDIDSERMAGMVLPFMAGGAKIDNRGFIEHKEVIRTVRGMAGGAFPLGDWLVLGLRSLLAGERVGMAVPAQIEHRFLQQSIFR